MTRWKTEILNSLESIGREYECHRDGHVIIRNRRLHIEVIERNNKVIKIVKNVGNGYHNLERFRNRLLYVLRKDAPQSVEPMYETKACPGKNRKDRER